MNCPKCQTPNPEEAKSCSLCHEFFVKKTFAPNFLIIDSVTTSIKGWHFTGPLVANGEALYFFVEREEWHPSGLARVMGLLVGQAGGVLGGVVVDQALEASGRIQERPQSLTFSPADELEPLKEYCMKQAPRLAFCRKYFKISRANMRAAWIPEDDRLLVHGHGCTLEVTGDLPEETITGYLKLWSYPVKPFGSARTRWAKLLAGLLVLGGVLASLADVYEINTVGRRFASLAIVRQFVYSYFFYFVLLGTGLFILIATALYATFLSD